MKVSRRTKLRDYPDWILGRYFLYTFPYGLFYIIGAGVGYSRTGNLFCLLGSGGIGCLMIVLAMGHSIDYYRRVHIESFYIAIPFG
jgi:hypothetical protein